MKARSLSVCLLLLSLVFSGWLQALELNEDVPEVYVVQKGDTLWGITSRLLPDGRLTMNQAMIAIYEANPDAFVGNINRLKAGVTLRIPSADSVFQIAAHEEVVPLDELYRVCEVARELLDAKQVIIVPGYGMAVAQAQHIVHELTQVLRDKKVNVRFGIHPVAGRMPGHMNVLLAEAKVPYDIVFEMDEINEDFPDVDVSIVIGANDIVNPSALTDPEGPIGGMPVLECWEGKTTIVLKRSMATGYAGVQNPLFFLDNTRMLFGDAKDSLEAVFKAL